MHLSGLYIHPVKSLRGIAVSEAAVDELGLVGDRRFLVIDPNGRFLTQRTHPRMALVTTSLAGGHLTLSTAGDTGIQVSLLPDPAAPLRTVEVWKSTGLQAEDCGAEAASWLSSRLGLDCHLVRIGPAFTRPIPEHKRPATLPTGLVPRVSFADAFPFLILSEASLGDLNDRLQARNEERLPLDRFRANLIVSGCAPYAEDTWKRFRIRSTVFHAGGPCARCIMTTTNQETAERGIEPLRTLAGYRRDAVKTSEVNFGQNLIHENFPANLRVGDPVELLD